MVRRNQNFAYQTARNSLLFAQRDTVDLRYDYLRGFERAFDTRDQILNGIGAGK